MGNDSETLRLTMETWLKVLLLAGLVLPTSPLALRANASESDQRMNLACSFLSPLYDPLVHLVREKLSVSTYYIASDNLLAGKALENCNPGLSLSIQAALNNATCCQEGNDLMHESIFGRHIPLPVHIANTYNVTEYWKATVRAQASNYTVYWEYHNGTETLSPFSYADVTAYKALELNLRGNSTGADEMASILGTMWDGRGMVDEPYKESHENSPKIYQTYKAALYMLVLTRLSMVIPSGLAQTVLRMQGLDGGFHTGYAADLTYAGSDENAETTSIAMIMLNERPPSQDMNVAYVPAVLGSALALLLGLVALRRQAAKKVAAHSTEAEDANHRVLFRPAVLAFSLRFYR